MSAGKATQRETTAVIQGDLQAGSEGLRNGPQQMGNPDIGAFSLEAGLSQFEETLVQPAEAKRQSRKCKIRELDGVQIVFVFSVKGIVTLLSLIHI